MQKSLLLKLHIHPSPLWVIFEVNFLRSFAMALLTSIFPLYLRSFVGSDAAVGGIFLLGYGAGFIATLYSGVIVEQLKKRKTLLLALACFTLVFASFASISHKSLVLLFFALYQFIISILVMDISLYIKHYSNYRHLAANTGKLGSFGNIGWLVGPLLGSMIAEKFGFETAFYMSSAISLLALFSFFSIRLSHEEVRFTHKGSMWKNIRGFFKNPNLRRTYVNNAGLTFIYSIWDFLPLIMLNLGATIPIIGMTKTLMGVPHSIFEYPIGQVADRETGERKIFIVGYLLCGIFTALLGTTENLRVFITFFFIAATGASFLEMTRDAYFFRQVPERAIEDVAVFRTSDTLGFLASQALATFSLLFIPLNWWFIIAGSLSVLFAVNAYRLKELKK